MTDDVSDAHVAIATPASDDSAAPLLRIVKGGVPAPEELAALTAVIATHNVAPPDEPEPLRRPLSPWVASGLAKGTRTKA